MIQKDTIWTEELNRLADILKKAPLDVDVKWGADVYTYHGTNIVSYGGFKHHFALWFYNGVFLSDPYNKLVAAQSKTKAMRQWRFTSISEIDESMILSYVLEAIEIERKGLKVKPDKSSPLVVPEEFAQALADDQHLKVQFDLLTPGKQKEYIQYIHEAKQTATKLKRIEKIVPLILSGQGLNDKYK